MQPSGISSRNWGAFYIDEVGPFTDLVHASIIIDITHGVNVCRQVQARRGCHFREGPTDVRARLAAT